MIKKIFYVPSILISTYVYLADTSTFNDRQQRVKEAHYIAHQIISQLPSFSSLAIIQSPPSTHALIQQQILQQPTPQPSLPLYTQNTQNS